MYTDYPRSSLVTAIIPDYRTSQTIRRLNHAGHDVMTWAARGSLKDTRWYSKLIPAMSPEKNVLRIIVSNDQVEDVIRIIVRAAKLDRHATGAAFATPMESLAIGGLFHASCEKIAEEQIGDTSIRENLDVIYCVVNKNSADKIANAAIDAGSHGPIVHYGEGRGLRDRLGWLRITKEQEKEVLTIVTDNRKAASIFDAMARAGNIDRPGNGFMYQMPVEKGLFNLRSFYSGNSKQFDLQQIVAAVDHLMGNDEWREESIVSGINDTCSAGLEFMSSPASNLALEDQVCITMIVDREHEEQVTDIMLNAGASGLSVNYAQLHSSDAKPINKGVKLVEEYGIIRTVLKRKQADALVPTLKSQTEAQGIEDACLFTQPVARVLTYVHHPRIEKRRTAAERNAA